MKTYTDGVGTLAADPSPADRDTSDNGPQGAVLGTLVGFTPDGVPLVSCLSDRDHGGRGARSCVMLDTSHLGAQVVLVFESGDARRPIVVGVIGRSTGHTAPADLPSNAITPAATEVEIDGTTVVLKGEERVVLRCGEASITLTRDGKVVVKGTHVVSHSRGVNRIRGGSVELN